ncbi:hypothetical protein [Dactylosporangium sp. NPDC005555]
MARIVDQRPHRRPYPEATGTVRIVDLASAPIGVVSALEFAPGSS